MEKAQAKQKAKVGDNNMSFDEESKKLTTSIRQSNKDVSLS